MKKNQEQAERSLGNSSMYGETFKDALYGAFQPEEEECDPSFLVRLLEYFPTDKVDVGSGTYDQYLYDLEKTVVDNYEKGNYQVSFSMRISFL